MESKGSYISSAQNLHMEPHFTTFLNQLKTQDFDHRALQFYYKVRHFIFNQLEIENLNKLLKEQPQVTLGRAVYTIAELWENMGRKKIEELQNDKQNCEQNRVKWQTYCKTLMNENRQLQKRNQMIMYQNEELDRKLNEVQEKQQQASRIYEEYEKILDQKEKLKTQNAVLINRLSLLQEECNELDLQNGREINNLTKMNQIYENQIQNLKIELINVEANKNHAEQLHQKLLYDFTQLNKKYGEKAQLCYNFIDHNIFNGQGTDFNSPQFARQITSFDKSSEPIRQFQQSNELKGLQFHLTDSVGRQSKPSSKYTIEEHMMIVDYEEGSVNPNLIDKSTSFVKENSMINSVQEPRGKKSSRSKTKSIGKYTSIKKKEEGNDAHKYHTDVKVQPLQFQLSGKKKYTAFKSPRTYIKSKKSEIMDRMLNEKLSEKSKKIHNLQAQLQILRSLCLQQKHSMTNLEGEYQLEMQELKSKLSFTKDELKELFSQNCHARAKCDSYEEEIQILEQELEKTNLEYDLYCDMVRRKYKSYLVNIIQNIEKQYGEIVKQVMKHKESVEEENGSYIAELQKQINKTIEKKEKLEITTFQISHENLQKQRKMSSMTFDIAKIKLFKIKNLKICTFTIAQEQHKKRHNLQYVSLINESYVGNIEQCQMQVVKQIAPISDFLTQACIQTQSSFGQNSSKQNSNSKSLNTASFMQNLKEELHKVKQQLELTQNRKSRNLSIEHALSVSHEANYVCNTSLERNTTIDQSTVLSLKSEERFTYQKIQMKEHSSVMTTPASEDMTQDQLQRYAYLKARNQEVENLQGSQELLQLAKDEDKEDIVEMVEVLNKKKRNYSKKMQENIEPNRPSSNAQKHQEVKKSILLEDNFYERELSDSYLSESQDEPQIEEQAEPDEQDIAWSVPTFSSQQKVYEWKKGDEKPFEMITSLIGKEVIIFSQKNRFHLNEKRLLNLDTGKYIYFVGRNIYMNWNFTVFSQTDLQVTPIPSLRIKRRAKKYPLRGNHCDGEWDIDEMIVLERTTKVIFQL